MNADARDGGAMDGSHRNDTRNLRQTQLRDYAQVCERRVGNKYAAHSSVLEALVLDTLQDLRGHLLGGVLGTNRLAAVVEVEARLLDVLDGGEALLLRKDGVGTLAQTPNVV